MKVLRRSAVRLAFWAAISLAVTGPARGDLVPGAPPVTDSPLGPPFYTSVASATSGGVTSIMYMDVFSGKMTVQYDLSIAMLNGIMAGDSLVFRGFGGAGATSISYATPPYGGPTAFLPPVPFQNSRSTDGNAITFSDFRRIDTDPGPIGVPLEIRIATDALSYTNGTAELDRGGAAIASFDTLVPVMTPEPSTLISGVIAGLIGAAYLWRRASRPGESRALSVRSRP
jgi:hypothetical protein